MTMERKKRRRNRKMWRILIYLCCFEVGSMDLGLQSGVTIFVNMVKSLSIIIHSVEETVQIMAKGIC